MKKAEEYWNFKSDCRNTAVNVTVITDDPRHFIAFLFIVLVALSRLKNTFADVVSDAHLAVHCHTSQN